MKTDRQDRSYMKNYKKPFGLLPKTAFLNATDFNIDEKFVCYVKGFKDFLHKESEETTWQSSCRFSAEVKGIVTAYQAEEKVF